MRRTTTAMARAFTLIELLIAIFVIAVLMGLLLVGFSHAIKLAKRTAAGQDVTSVDMAVQQFKNDFGFLPPLVKDGFPGTPDTSGPLRSVGNRTIPNVYTAGDQQDLRYLRGESGDPEYRFSVYSPAYYLMGGLGKEVDGVEGPGAKTPSRDGTFNPLATETYEPLFDPRTGSLEIVDASEGRIELRDPNGVAYRYYRWARGTMNPNDSDKGVLNLPSLVESGMSVSELGSAEYAIVAAGPDGFFGQIGVMHYPGQPADAVESAALIEAELGERFGSDAEAERAARADNIVRAGR